MIGLSENSKILLLGVVVTALDLSNESIQLCYTNIPFIEVQDWFTAALTTNLSQNVTVTPSAQCVAFQVGLFNAILGIGGILGGFIPALLADRYGRRIVMFQFNGIMVIIATGLTVLSYDRFFAKLMIFSRFVHGIDVGMSLAILPVFVTEMCGKDIRGLLAAIRGPLAFAAGDLTYALTLPSALGNPKRFRELLLLPLIVGIPLFILGFLVPETPKFLFEKYGDMERVNYAMRHFYKDASEVVDFSDVTARAERNYGFMRCFRTKIIRRALFVTVVVAAVRSFTGSPIVEIYSKNIIIRQHHNISVDTLNKIIVLHEAVAIIFCIVGVYLIHRVGRRSSLLWATFVHVVLWILFLILTYANQRYKSPAVGWIALITFFSQEVVVYPLAAATVPYFFGAEVVQTEARSVAATISNVSLFFSFFVVTLAYPALQHAMGALALVIVTIAPLTLCWIYMFFYMPETKNKTISEIVACFDY